MLLVLTFCLITIIIAQSPSLRCCVDKQYHLTMGQTGGSWLTNKGNSRYHSLIGYSELYFDDYRKMSVIEQFVDQPDGSVKKTLIYNDFPKNMQYVFSDGKCWVERSFFPYRGPCIPDDAVYLGSTYIGYGPSEIPVTKWEYVVPAANHMIKFSVSKDGCIPITDTIYGHWKLDNGETMSLELTFLMSNFKPGISDPSIFELPVQCHNATHIPGPI